ncbi:efflux ABC transporter, permease protein [Mobiluncus mulieris ATCC 35239]|uniref:Efflux ABC transporter, permease protein n=2 Tax=Mobiluncus mulieris TaxID=2052 RepID=E0QS27_9ACTO|nr:FtsX-like permease family protein [Mobiluncus mulieris]EFM45603.1 efflux ABC transporter, permease protein [Mobiluncus mulieris ATCC 35239]MCU9972167.1 FtsX-like permease family protein [Mobiluncus mulieris]MCU9994778.1 FtsX-like permease family protein [Mobiluncus mulieris]MCV0014628.1 FtsX-like permease family protein [Mobiluncus mulieris]NMW91993.1 FtsX-like permease family protein [Mobiluncus mulieris]
MLELAKLATRLLKGHKSLYLSCAVTISIVTILSSAQVALGMNLSNPALVHVDGVSSEEVSLELIPLRGVLIFLGIILLVLSSFLIFSAIVQVVQLRGEEIQLLKLSGASKTQLNSLIAFEAFALGLFVGIPSAVIGSFFSIPQLQFLGAIGFFGKSLHVTYEFNFMQVLFVVGLVIFECAVAGYFATIKVGSEKETKSAIKRISPVTVVWRVLLALAIGIFLFAVNLDAFGGLYILLVPLMIVIAILLVAPLFIPIVSKLIGNSIGLFRPGIGLLVSQVSQKNVFRLSHYAAPPIICLGIVGTFIALDFPTSEMLYQDFYNSSKASSVFITEGSADANKIYDLVSAKSADVSRIRERLITDKRGYFSLYYVDFKENFNLLNQKLIQGQLDNVGNTNVASSISGSVIGDKVTIYNENGESFELTVTALLHDSVHEGYFIDWPMLSHFPKFAKSKNTETMVFARGITPQMSQDIAKSVNSEIKVLTRYGYAKYLQNMRHVLAFRGNVGMFGVILIMTLIALLQLTISEEIARRKQCQQLHALGVDNKDILSFGLATVLSTQLVSLLLTLLSLLFTAYRCSSAAQTSTIADFMYVMPLILICWVSILLFTLVIQTLATHHSLRAVL